MYKNPIPDYIPTPDPEPKDVSEKDDSALYSQARYNPDPEKRSAAEDELEERAAERAEKRKREQAAQKYADRFNKLAPHARRRYFEKHGRKPTEEQVEQMVEYMIEDGLHKSLPDADALGDERQDQYLPPDLAEKRKRERARQ
jgi:hypothetical protein